MASWKLFEVTGVELEYMIVHRDTLDIDPAADELLKMEAGVIMEEVEREGVSWSNELALHVIELKTAPPVRSLTGTAAVFQKEINLMNEHLTRRGSRLLPSAMHPWMDPEREMKLWPHSYNEIYEQFNRIFNCRGHGWSNLQSVHINLPFSNEEEFGLLHAAIRMILPILPAIASSSPYRDGKPSGFSDTRLEVYRHNQKRIPSITGQVIPEPCYTFEEYRKVILEPSFEAIRPYDPEGILQEEWLNSRGAIARFERGSIEIRLLDIQETPFADLAIVTLIVETLKYLLSGDPQKINRMKQFPSERLSAILFDLIRNGSLGLVKDQEYLSFFNAGSSRNALKLWETIRGELEIQTLPVDRKALNEADPYLENIFRFGNLTDRILKKAAGRHDRITLQTIYADLADCLAGGKMFGVNPV